MPPTPPTPPPPTDKPRDRFPLLATTLILLALTLRLPLLTQSLWYDEISTIINYVRQPWEQTVAGTYSPNNHVLFTLLAKMCDELTGRELLPFATRFPSAVAGSFVGLALAWPLRRAHPLHAAGLMLLASLHPWLFSFSGWARGYALLLLLAVLSTTLLPSFSIANPKVKIAKAIYGQSLVALLYTHPLGIAVCVGHAAWMLPRSRTDRAAFNRWFITCSVAAVFTLLIYSPFIPRLGDDYWKEAEKPSITYPTFLRQSLVHAHLGDGSPAIIHLILPLLICTAGLTVAWRRFPDLRPTILTFAVASAFGLLAPLILPLAGEVRAMIWLIPLYCIGAFALIAAALASTKPLRYTALAATAALAIFLTLRLLHITRTPGQPIREASELARHVAGDTREVIGVYMASAEARLLYPNNIDRLAYKLRPESPPEEYPSLLDAERHLLHPPVLVLFYEDFLKRDQPDLWTYIHEHYTPTHHLPGRISPATIYQKK
jgi:hypothetical protein